MNGIAPKVGPIACTLVAGDDKRRLDLIAELNRAGLLGSRREATKLILTYRADQTDLVRQMVRTEEKCCAFLTFEFDEAGSDLVLTISAPPEMEDVCDVLFAPFTSEGSASDCGCSSDAREVSDGAH